MRNAEYRRITALMPLTILALTVVAPAQRPKHPDRERDDLAGPVKSVEVAIALSGDLSRFIPLTVSSYSSDGWLTEQVSFVEGREPVHMAIRDTEGVRHVSSTSPEALGFGVRMTRLQPRGDAPTRPRGADGTYPFAIQRLFDSAGRLISDIVYAGDTPTDATALVGRLVYRYDDAGRLTEWSRYYGRVAAPYEKEVLTYDEHDHVRESILYKQGNGLPSRRTFTYDYDERGNWTRRVATETLSGAPVVSVMTRKIAYY